MSVITVQIGQCGNQLGYDFLNSVAQELQTDEKNYAQETEYHHRTTERFFHHASGLNTLTAKAVLVDTEPKVIQEIISTKNKWQYQQHHVYVQQQGAANNWACGYYKHGANAKEKVLELFQSEAEKSDYISGFMPMVSLAGGTGSGLGAYLTEILRDNFPKTCIFTQAVHPFNKGEVAVQSYNTILSLCHLQNSSDAVALFKNDDLQRVCTQRMSLKNISLHHLNKVIVQSLVGLLFPSYSSSRFITNLGDVMSQCVSHPQFKLLNVMSVPQESAISSSFSSYSWQGLLKSLRRMLLYSTSVDEVTTPLSMTNSQHQMFLSNLLILRGMDNQTVDHSVLQRSLSYSKWIPDNCKFNVWNSSQPVLYHDKVATLTSNGQFILPTIQQAMSKAWNMFSVKAYLHHYHCYGLMEEDIVYALAHVEQIIASYKSLSGL